MSIYETQNCNWCGCPYYLLPARSPNGGWWEHDGHKWCMLAIKRYHEEKIEALNARIVALESRPDYTRPLGSTIEV